MEISAHFLKKKKINKRKFKQGYRNSRQMLMVFLTYNIQWKFQIGHYDFFI